MNNEIIKLSIDKYKVVDIDNTHLSKVELYVCHDKDNKNGSYFSLENMVRNQKSILRKPLLYKMNSQNSDYMEHEIDVQAAGYIPEIGNDMRYEEMNGRIYFVVSAIVWNVYCPEVVAIFERDESKGISMEIEVLNSAKREDGLRDIIDYRYLGVVMLGDDYETGMHDTTAKLVNFSVDKFNEKIQESENILNNIDNSIFTNVDIDNNFEGGKTMFDRDAHAETFKMTAKDVMSAMRDSLSEENCWIEDYCADFIYVYAWEDSKFYKVPYKMENAKCSVDYGCKSKVKYAFVDVEDEDDVPVVGFAQELVSKAISEESEKFNKEIEDLKAEIESIKNDRDEYSAKLEELNATIETNESEKKEKEDAIFSLNEEVENLKKDLEVKNSEIEELNTFKEEKEKEAKANQVAELFSKIGKALDKNELDEWKAKESEFENLEDFEKELKNFALSKVLENIDKKQTFSRVAVDNIEDEVEPKSKDIWSKVDELIK